MTMASVPLAFLDGLPPVALLAVKITLVLAAGLGLAHAMPRLGASARHLVLTLAAAIALLLPVAAVLVPVLELRILPAIQQIETRVSADTIIISAAPARAAITRPSRIVAPVPVPGFAATAPAGPIERSPSKPMIAIAIWVAGMVVVTGPWLLGIVRRRRLERRCTDLLPPAWERARRTLTADGSLWSHVRVLATRATDMPMTWGVVRPVIVIPAHTHWSHEERCAALLHEMAHIARRDAATQGLFRALCAFYWWHPLAWVLARRAKLAQETACDDAVLRAGARPSSYAEQLLGVAEASGRTALPVAALTMARRSALAARLASILDERRDRGATPAGLRVAGVLCGGALLLVVGAAMPVPRAVASPAVPAFPAPPQPVAPPQAAHPAIVRAASGVTPSVSVTRAIAAPAAAASAPAIPAPVEIVLPTPPRSEQVTVVAAARPRPARTIELGTLLSDAGTQLIDWAGRAVADLVPVRASLGSADCELRGPGGKGANVSIRSSSGRGGARWQITWKRDNCTIEVDARGDFTLSADATDIATISRGGSFVLKTDDGTVEREVRLEPGAGGLERDYRVNGRRAAWDAAAAQWLSQTIVGLDRRTAFAVDVRFPVLFRNGGVDGVLAEIEQMDGDYAERVYFTRLLAAASVTSDQLRRVIRLAADRIQSDYEMAELLLIAGRQRSLDEPVQLEFARATTTIESDYERRRALSALLAREGLPASVARAMLVSASTMRSDYELAELLIAISRRYAGDAETQEAYLDAMTSIGSDYEYGRVLKRLVAGEPLSSAQLIRLIDDASEQISGYELAEALLAIAKSERAVTGAPGNSLVRASRSVSSDFERRRVMNAMLRHPLDTLVLEQILEEAPQFRSSHERAELLIAVASRQRLSGGLREAYLRAAASIPSEHDRGRALSAGVRAQ